MTARRRPTTKPKASSFEDVQQSGLRLHASGKRHRDLRQERERLLQKVRETKLALTQAIENARTNARTMLEKMAPFMARHEAATTKLHQLFEELLAPGRLSATARKKVAVVRRKLVRQGLLEGAETAAEEGPDDFGPFDTSEDSFGPEEKHSSGETAEDIASAAPRGQTPGNESLRSLFKRLTLAVHPDRAAHEDDRERRTEAMKQVTQAYQNGDLASLLEFEKSWQNEGAVAAAGDEEAQCRELERIVAELRAQVKQLEHEIREVIKSAPPPFVVRSLDFVVAQAKGELEELETVCAFVESFRDGKITLAAFVRGPEIVNDGEGPDLEFLAAQLMGDLFMPKRRSKGSKKSYDDVPF